jgi:hypothetical protein
MSSGFRRAAEALAPGVLVGLPALPWVRDACARAVSAAIGRDQGIFQYAAWATEHGAKLYRDVRDVNGPLVVLMHRLFFVFGGEDPHRFRALDLVLTSGTAAFVGACLPDLDTKPRPLQRAALALVVWLLFVAQYLSYGSWDTAQRESFFDAFLCLSLGALLRAQATGRLWGFALAGASSLAPWLGKPTYALFTIALLVAIAIERTDVKRRIGAFAAGGILGALVPFAFLVARGDVGAWARITFHDVPAMYRFIWPHTILGTLTIWRDNAILAAGASAALLAFVVTRRISVRALPIALVPVLGLASVVIQRKGFLYHFHPATLGAVLVLGAFVQRAWSAASERRSFALHALAVALAVTLGARTEKQLRELPYPSLPAPDATIDERLAPYTRVDFFPVGLRHAADELLRATKPGETVQTYGMDPYVLFLAQRKSTTPYVYAYDLNVDAALHGSFDEGGPVPDDAQRAAIQALRDAHERDLLARMQASPPAAFVFLDRSPLLSLQDARADFEWHCPDAWSWLALRYHEVTSDEGIRVWLRNE